MNANITELNMEEMESVNAVFSPIACVIGTVMGAGKGAIIGGAIGMLGGPPGISVRSSWFRLFPSWCSFPYSPFPLRDVFFCFGSGAVRRGTKMYTAGLTRWQ